MIDQQFFTKQFQKSLIEETAARLGLPPASVEKDWWVCVVLEALYADSALHSLLTFKGGTSLSKAYGLIRRFSEDIDIVVDRRYLGFTGSRDPEMVQSRSAQKRLVEELKTSCADFIRSQVIPSLHRYLEASASNFHHVITLDPHDQDGLTILVSYAVSYTHLTLPTS
ncbi:MAG: nucleotidyl transferase AbiEii/AbiGii toxin family protein, partial [Rectinema sp.]|nr:nucleotidyl transferase AbiEii/AbiGii toxin family protein [Rectinema sp.]